MMRGAGAGRYGVLAPHHGVWVPCSAAVRGAGAGCGMRGMRMASAGSRCSLHPGPGEPGFTSRKEKGGTNLCAKPPFCHILLLLLNFAHADPAAPEIYGSCCLCILTRRKAGRQAPKGICQHNCLQPVLGNQMQQGRVREKKKRGGKNPFLGLASVQHTCQAVQEQGERKRGAIWHPHSPQTVWVGAEKQATCANVKCVGFEM